MTLEIWLPIEGFDHYQVSNLGRVRVEDRLVSCHKTHFRKVKGQLRKTFVSRSTGYVQVSLRGGERKTVHRLVALAFCEGWFEGAVVNHKNGIRDDNRAENLEWVTHSDNLRHGYRVLGAKRSSLGKFSSDHSTSKAVVATCMVTGAKRFYGCGMDAVREGFRSDCISRCCHGKIAYHKGFYWAFHQASDVQVTR